MCLTIFSEPKGLLVWANVDMKTVLKELQGFARVPLETPTCWWLKYEVMYKGPKTKSNKFSYNFCLMGVLLIWCPESEKGETSDQMWSFLANNTPWGSGGWRSWFPGLRRWRWRSCGGRRWGRWWQPSPPPPPPLQLARSPENQACMSICIKDTNAASQGLKATICVNVSGESRL